MSHQTNLERWNFYMKDRTAPQVFIDMGFYSMISCALQRRVWLGSYDMPLFPNMYVVVVDSPGIGKGIVIKPIKALLSSITTKSKSGLDEKAIKESLESLAEQVSNEADREKLKNLNAQYQAKGGTTAGVGVAAQKLIQVLPHAADTTTFEALSREQALSIRRLVGVPKDRFAPTGVYNHNSMHILVEEMGTLFRKQHEQLMRYFLTVFDCGDFEYKTKHQGEDIIKNVCLNILAGTNPGFMKDSITTRVIDEGFTARTIFVYASAKRFHRFDQAAITPEQLVAYEQVRQHIIQLTKLYGQVTYSPDAHEFFRHYAEEVMPFKRVNPDHKLEHYYGRKEVHMQKMALAVHFADKTDMTITLEDCQLALKTLEGVEKAMHFALSTNNVNPTTEYGADFREYIKKFGNNCPYAAILLYGISEKHMERRTVDDTINFLISTGQVTRNAKGCLSVVSKGHPKTAI